MDFKFSKMRTMKILAFAFSFALILTAIGCVPPNTTITTNVNAPAGNKAEANSALSANTNAGQQQKVPEQNQDLATKMPVTLPVLDAMFSDENFAADLKSKLQLTDEQIDKLKNVSHQAVASLKETNDEASGSTRASEQRASRQIKEMLGENDADKFFNFVRERWSGDNGGGENTGNNNSQMANAVPTDTRIVVNAPEYRMDVFQDGKLVKSYKVGIGYPEFPLPSGMRKANEIIFNPTWTPPDEPWVEGSNKVKAGETVKAGDKLNPLGPIKIPIGLPSLIHGGKNPAKLGTFASHGCVGLTDKQVQDFSLDLAGISGTELSKENVADYAKQKTETKNVKLSKPIPVELRYQTIVVEDGKLKIFRDVYEKGTNTEENLRKVLESYGVSFDDLKPQEQQKILDGLKQMAIDATGNPVEPNANTNSKSSNAEAKTNSNNSNSKNVPITRTIKGKKEIEFELTELKNKGYPAPVNLNTGK